MKKIVSILLLAALLPSCKKGDSPTTDLNGDYIHIGASSAATRGQPIETIDELPYINVLTYYHKGSWDDLSPANQATVYMDNVKVDHKSSTWVYAPLASWPKEGNLSFFCYYPTPSPQNGVTVTQSQDGTLPQLTYSVPETVEDQPDIMISTTGTRDMNRSGGTSAVNFSLVHALTCLSLKATGNGEFITAVKISGVAATGTLAVGGPAVQWMLDLNDVNRTFSAGVNDQILDPTPSSILNHDGLLMMLPQTLTDAATLTITIDDGNRIYDRNFALNIPGFDLWRAGTVMEYNFSISSTGSIIMNPAQITLPGTQGASSIFAIVCPAEAETTDWTVSTDNGGWLQISDNPDGTNTDPTQTNPYSYGGQGSKLLYAYAATANGNASERVSLVKLTPSAQQIEVTQLSANGIYSPIASDGWAGSNIYWEEDNTLPEGGRLTFADRGDAGKESYQGVYFMWGSLVALSPKGNSWTGQTLHIPNPDRNTNGGWDSSQKGWGYIPRLGWSNPSNPDNGGSAVAIASNNSQSYLYQNHNAKGNVGDICKYITDRGWAPGVRQGRKWRMATHRDYNALQPITMQKRGVFTSKYPTDANGQETYGSGFEKPGEVSPIFLPTSGFRDHKGSVDTYAQYRPGEAFMYWLGSQSTPNSSNADPIYYWLGITSPVSQYAPRNYGATVRCVEER